MNKIINNSIVLLYSFIILTVFVSYVNATEKIQNITFSHETIDTQKGSLFTLTASYDVSNNDNTLTGIGLRFHYDSSKLNLIDYSDHLSGTSGIPLERAEKENEDDLDSSTDRVLIIAWSDPFGGNWPGKALPLEIIKMKFQVKDDADVGQTNVNITFSSNANGYQGSSSNLKININGNTPPQKPNVSWSIDSQTVSESIGAVTITAQLNKVYDQSIQVPLNITGTAIIYSDYSIDNNSIVIPAGKISNSLILTINDDDLTEDDERIFIKMIEPANADLGSTIVHQITILNNDIEQEKIQYVELSPSNLEINNSDYFILKVLYNTSDGNNLLSGLGIRIHYNSQQLELLELLDCISGTVGQPLDRLEKDNEDDGDNNTDRVYVVGWSDPFNASWPGETLPAELIKLKFQVKDNVSDTSSSINVTFSSTAIGYLSNGKPAIINISNQSPPYVYRPILDFSVLEDSTASIISLKNLFADSNNSPITSNITKELINNSNTSLVSAVCDDNNLVLDYQKNQYGFAKIDIKGTSDGESVSSSFTVTVKEVCDIPELIQPITNKEIVMNAEDTVISLDNIFKNLDNNDSSFSITGVSSNEYLVVPSVEGKTLTLKYLENQTGIASIILTAASGCGSITNSFDVHVTSYTPSEIQIYRDIRAVTGSSISIPIHLTNSMNTESEGKNLKISFDPTILKITETVANLAGILDNKNYELTAENLSPGQISLVFYGKQNLNTDSGIVALLQFEVIGNAGETTELVFDEAIFNNSPMIKHNGLFTVKSPPKAINSTLTLDEDSSGNLNLIATDADSDPLYFTIVDNAKKGNAKITDNVSGSCTYTPDPDKNGSDFFTFIVSDGNSNSNTATVNIIINPINDPPTISNITDKSGCKNIKIKIPYTIDDIDTDLENLNVSGETSNFSTLTFDVSGTNRFVIVNPLTEYIGTTSITITVNDGENSDSTNFNFVTNDISLRAGNDISTKIYPNQNISIPLFLTSDTAVNSVSMTVLFDNNVFSKDKTAAVLAGGVLNDEGYSLTVINETENSISLLIKAVETPIIANGIIAYLNLKVDKNAIIGEETRIEFKNNQAIFNEWTMTANKGLYIVDGFLVSGNVRFNSDKSNNAVELTPVANVHVSLVGSKVYTTTTDEYGNYSFYNMPSGIYLLELTKSDDLSGLSLTDAFWISRHYSQPQYLDCYQQIAANTDDDQEATIRGIDASRVARYVMRFITELNEDNIHWVFMHEDINECSELPRLSDLSSKLIEVNSNQSNDFIAIRVGDVTRNWKADPKNNTKRARSEKRHEAIPYIIDDDNSFKIPIVFNQEDMVKGMSLHITFDEKNLRFKDAFFNQSTFEYNDYKLLINKNINGNLYIGILATKNVVSVQDEDILSIEFKVTGQEESILSIADFKSNESYVSNGGFLIDNDVTKDIKIIVNKLDNKIK